MTIERWGVGPLGVRNKIRSMTEENALVPGKLEFHPNCRREGKNLGEARVLTAPNSDSLQPVLVGKIFDRSGIIRSGFLLENLFRNYYPTY